ncbi:pentatricopeptide repeat-containing protein At2g34400-like isoform X1 [Nicotiana tabacum]|uniref:Pentatricopeptide repeat-containing protein At2g34400-like n=10 Tax=Nicotiana tabacum TaxID=4097 RepID=A0A1S4B3J2_TOBAC|nr:PREDICTED: pentatricopeptide repeat-containing protein At2g34400-like [Nicotiana tabacum]XP_016483412.1 PREDICTED: pentatricopeptide repeat-containing protein At2g34400-like [Nicotiana tabacum]
MFLRAELQPCKISRFFSIEATKQAFNNQQGYSPITQQLLRLLNKCITIKQVQQIHTQMLIYSIDKANYLLSKIIDLKHFNYATLLFSHIHSPNEYAFNILIRGLTTTWQKFDLSLELYYKMKSLGLKTDNFTYPFVFMCCGNLLAVELGKLAHCEVVKNGLFVDFHVGHSLITMYSRIGKMGFARKMFDEMSQRDLVSWNSMISGYAQTGCSREAVGLFIEMRNEGFEPDERTLVSVLGACGDLGDVSLGKRVEEYVVEKRMELNSFMGSALINMYGKCGDLVSARRIFDGMKKKDVITWNAMISGYAQNGLSDETISLFNAMKETGVNLNNITLVSVLSACASIGALDVGKCIDDYASRRGIKHDIYVATALIDMYAKCGNLDDAYQIFESMPRKNEVSWNAMISALAFHGRAQEALSLFERMSLESSDSRPDDVTFVGVLSACVHAGLVDEGRCLFDLMSSSFGLVPKVEHYSCMVDLLSRAGRVYEAWEFIEKMPQKPDEILLGALLGACQKLKNIDVGERVMQLLLEMEPSNSGNYIISSKIYANLRRWDDSARMRQLMRQKGVTKIPGCSWIEMDSQLVEFRAGSSSHPIADEIHQALDLLYEEMAIEGYVPNVNLV